MLALGQAGTEFKAPMRGLGVMRRGQQRGRISTRGGRDHFRERAQNTSRPPSMHVDDFVKIAHVPTNEPPPVSQGHMYVACCAAFAVCQRLILFPDMLQVD